MTSPLSPVSGPDASASEAAAVLRDAPPPQCTTLEGVNDRCPSWTTLFEDVGHAVAWYAAADPQGRRVYTTGIVETGETYDVSTAAYDVATGARLWTTRYAGANGVNDWPTGMAVAPDGSRVVVVGFQDRTFELFDGSGDYLTVAYDAASGAEIWSRSHDGPARGADTAFGVAISSDNRRAYVTGTSLSGTTDPDDDTDYLTVAYDLADGATAWEAPFRGDSSGVGDSDYALAVALSPDGSRAYVTGTTGRNTGSDYATVAYVARDPANPDREGNQLWMARHDGAGSYSSGDIAWAIQVSPDGRRVFVTGDSMEADGYAYMTDSYDALTGARLWSARFRGFYPDNDNNDNRATHLAVSPDGATVFVTGMSAIAWPLFRFGTVAYDAATGSQRWAREGSTGYPTEAPGGLAVSPDGRRVYVSGTAGVPGLLFATSVGSLQASIGATKLEAATAAYDAATGAPLWAARHDFPSTNLAGGYGMALTPDGQRLLVAGGFREQPVVGSDARVQQLVFSYAT